MHQARTTDRTYDVLVLGKHIAREDKDMTEKVKDRQTATKGLLDQVLAQLTLTRPLM